LQKLGNDARLQLMRQALLARDWPNEPKELIAHFIDAFEIIVGNRNHLMHSNLTAGFEDKVVALYSLIAQGKQSLPRLAWQNFGKSPTTWTHISSMVWSSLI
jgi:hypothetical protein